MDEVETSALARKITRRLMDDFAIGETDWDSFIYAEEAEVLAAILDAITNQSD